MPQRVRDLRDLCLLFVKEEGEKEMGAPKKTRAELLDKIIQFIWDYQDKHNGDTPALGVIEKHVGITGGGGGYYIAILVDEGRLNRIGTRPFRVTITENRENRRAIERFKRIRERLERADENERQRVREEQERLRSNEQHEQDRGAALALVDTDTVVTDRPKAEVIAAPKPLERPAIAENWDRQLGEPAHAVERYSRANSDYMAARREVKAEMPKLLKIADERDLVFELVSRGYRVDKVR